MEKDIKDTLEIVADYHRADKRQSIQILKSAFISMLITGTFVFLLELFLYTDIWLVVGEAVILLAGSCTLLIQVVKNGMLEDFSKTDATPKENLFTGFIIALLFAAAYTPMIYKQTNNPPITALLCIVCISLHTIIGYFMNHILRKWNNKSKRNHTNN